MSGLNADAPLAKGRRDKLTGERDYSLRPHQPTRQVILGAGSFHYGREDCKACGSFVRWIAKPANIERARINAIKFARLSGFPVLTSYEKHFVAGLKYFRRLSPRQQAFLDRTYGRYLEETRA